MNKEAIELAYKFCLAGNEAEAAKILGRVIDRRPDPKLSYVERKAIIHRRLEGYDARSRARHEKRNRVWQSRRELFPRHSVFGQGD